MHFLILFTLLHHLLNFSTADSVVDLSYGAIRGKFVTSRRGPQGYAFLSIPMTEPPVGALRFKEAVPIKPWKGILNCTEYKNVCPQPSLKRKNVIINQDEDCLYMNVMTPRYCLNKGNCSVYVFVHGGVLQYLSPIDFPEENVVNNYANEERRIVFVGIPYRLGILGLINLSPGIKNSADLNIGMRDLLFGLEWIQREIHNFGGNPEKVTLGGHSAGAFLLTELIFMRRADNFYHQAILMSPVYQGEINVESNSKYAQKFAMMIGCAKENETFSDIRNVENVLSCLRTKTIPEISKIQEDLENEVEQLSSNCVDGPDGIFPHTDLKNFKKILPKKRFMTGVTNVESKDTRVVIEPNGIINQSKLNLLCSMYAYEDNYDNPEAFRKKCNNYYNTVERVADIDDDRLTYLPLGQLADKIAKTETVYMYSFEYPRQGRPRYHWNISLYSPIHSDELHYCLWGVYDNFKEADFIVEHIFTGMFASFINTGVPTLASGQEWMPWSRKSREYFQIDFDLNFIMPGPKTGFHKEVAEFYEKLIPSAAGKSNSPIDYPPHHDSYKYYQSMRSIVSIWTNKSMLALKTFEAATKDAQLWIEHMQHLKALRNGQYSINWIFSLLALILCLILVYMLYLGVRKWEKRREYKLLQGHDDSCK